MCSVFPGAGGANLPPAGQMCHYRGEDMQSLQEEDRKQVTPSQWRDWICINFLMLSFAGFTCFSVLWQIFESQKADRYLSASLLLRSIIKTLINSVWWHCRCLITTCSISFYEMFFCVCSHSFMNTIFTPWADVNFIPCSFSFHRFLSFN